MSLKLKVATHIGDPKVLTKSKVFTQEVEDLNT